MKQSRNGPAIGHWPVVLGLVSLASVAGLLLDHAVGPTSLAMVYVLAVVVAAYKLPWVPSAATAFGAVTAFNFFFVPPRWTLGVESREQLIALFTMLVVALVISRLAAALRLQTETAQLNERRARHLQELAMDLASVELPGDVVLSAQKALSSAFDGPSIVALTDERGELEAASAFRDAMQCCMRDAATLGPGTGRWPGLNAWYVPLGGKGAMSGAVCVQNVAASDTAGREHAQALCTLVSQALLRLKLMRSMQAARDDSQRHHLTSMFLAAISHDFRTPLAAVMGAATSLLLQRDKLGLPEQERLLRSIVGESEYLTAVTENTLQLVRLNNTGEIQRDWESMEEIVGAVLGRVRQRDPQRRISSTVPAGLPLLRADPVLLAQLLENLLNNALKYSAGGIDLAVKRDHQKMQVRIEDRGPGIAQGDELAIFEPFRRSDRSAQRGAGLGLAVCKAIATAHDGLLTARPRAGGGTSMTLSLPIAPAQPSPELP